jgi:sulfur carrier protein ThiS
MATSVTVKAMSEVSRMLGWTEREVGFEGSTLEDLLKVLVTSEGQSLYSLIVEKGRFKGAYVISVNGHVVTTLETPLSSGDRVMTMEMVRLFHGG